MLNNGLHWLVFILCTRQKPKRNFYKAKTLMTITCSAWLQSLAQSTFATYKNTGFILLTIVRWDATRSWWSQLTDWFFLALKTLDPEMDRITQILSTCLNISLGTLPEISRKPEIWQKSFREASPRFYEQTTQANFGFVWLNRNFLWCQAAPLMGFVFMNLATSSKNGTFCFGGSDKKMSDNGSDTGHFTRASWVRIKTFIIHSKQKG